VPGGVCLYAEAGLCQAEKSQTFSQTLGKHAISSATVTPVRSWGVHNRMDAELLSLTDDFSWSYRTPAVALS